MSSLEKVFSSASTGADAAVGLVCNGTMGASPRRGGVEAELADDADADDDDDDDDDDALKSRD
jgi:hypothetical protein